MLALLTLSLRKIKSIIIINMFMNCWPTHELLSLSLPSAPIINNCPTPVPSLPLMLISHLNQHLQEGRLLVSTESDLTWLSKFRNLSPPFHQLVGVPVYEDGAGCRHHGGGGLPVRELFATFTTNNVQHSNYFRSLTLPSCQLWEMSLTS